MKDKKGDTMVNRSIRELTAKSFELRKMVLDMIYNAKAGHIGGDFSLLDILVVLYLKQMNINPNYLEDPNRDYFILSKGHSVESYYAILAEKGFLDKGEVVRDYCKFGSEYIGHPNNKLPGIEMNTGSLGHGLSVCTGIALASKMDQRTNRVYVVMGDGELAEGSVWEGFMAAGHYKLDNLCAVIDRNHLQISGTTEKVMSHDGLEDRIKSFNWNVIQVDGNDLQELDFAFNKAGSIKGSPTCIIANTTKGFGGGDLIENKAEWHHKVPTEEEYRIIEKELNYRREAALVEYYT